MEKRGKPSVNFATTFFLPLAKASARGAGMPDLPIIEVPHPLEGKPREEVQKVADTKMEDAVKAVTQKRDG